MAYRLTFGFRSTVILQCCEKKKLLAISEQSFAQITNDKEIQMSADVLSFTTAPFPQEAIVISNGDHRAAVAAARTDRRAQEIERLPFDLSALEEEGIFINFDAIGFGILDRRLDWQALGEELLMG